MLDEIVREKPMQSKDKADNLKDWIEDRNATAKVLMAEHGITFRQAEHWLATGEKLEAWELGKSHTDANQRELTSLGEWPDDEEENTTDTVEYVAAEVMNSLGIDPSDPEAREYVIASGFLTILSEEEG